MRSHRPRHCSRTPKPFLPWPARSPTQPGRPFPATECDMIGIKCASVLATASAAAGAAQVMDTGTLVPIGLLLGAVVLATTLTWRVSAFVSRLQSQAREQADRIA